MSLNIQDANQMAFLFLLTSQDSSGNAATSTAGVAIPPVQAENAAINLTAR